MSHAFMWFLSTIAARTLIVLLCIMFGFRILGKRQIGQMNIYDLALVMAIANAVQNAMTHGNGNLSVGVISAGTLLVTGWALTVVFVRLPKLEERLIGTPTLLVNDGHIIEDRMRRERVTHECLMTVLRQHGITDIKQVLMGVLEVDGSISIIPKTAEHKRSDKPFRQLD